MHTSLAAPHQLDVLQQRAQIADVALEPLQVGPRQRQGSSVQVNSSLAAHPPAVLPSRGDGGCAVLPRSSERRRNNTQHLSISPTLVPEKPANGSAK